jgi:hypothetical protein
MKYGYLIVEGHHDAEVIGRLLRRKKLIHVTMISRLDQYWKPMIPREFPPNGDLMKRVPTPLFFQNKMYSIAIQIAGGGLREIERKLEATLQNYGTLLSDVMGLGIVIDADYNHKGANGKFKELKKELTKLIRLPNGPGKVLNSRPKTGVFVFPDNKNKGTIEKILLKCGQQVYPDMLNGATNFVNGVNVKLLNSNDKKEFVRKSGKDKSTIGCMANILRPGKAMQVSIHDNDWISDRSLAVPEVRVFDQFLEELLGLS